MRPSTSSTSRRSNHARVSRAASWVLGTSLAAALTVVASPHPSRLETLGPAVMAPTFTAGKGVTEDCPPESDCDARRDMGRCYDLLVAVGQHVAHPPAKAISLCKAACEAGSPKSCRWLAGFKSRGGDEEYEEAVGLYMRACDQNDREACLHVAALASIGVDTDNYNFLHPDLLYYRECRANDPAGCLRAKEQLAAQKHVSPADFFERSKRACPNGFPLACVEVGQAKIDGRGTAANVADGVAQLDALCTGGNVTACAALIQYYSRADGDRSMRCLYEWKACDLGAAFACGDACGGNCVISGVHGEVCEPHTVIPRPPATAPAPRPPQRTGGEGVPRADLDEPRPAHG